MRLSARGPAAVDVVRERYRRPALWPTWAPHLAAVETRDETIRPGTRGVVRGPRPVRLAFVITQVADDGGRWAWVVGRRLRIPMRHGVDPDGGGSRAWVELAAPLAVPYAPLALWALRRLVRG